MEDFEVHINSSKYIIGFEKQGTICKPSNMIINCFYQGGEELLETKKFRKIKRRLYYNIINLNKLKDGLIRKYQVFNEIELAILEKYLINKNILFRICEENLSYKRRYNIFDKSYKLYFIGTSFYYPEHNKVFKNKKLYVEIFKGYVNLSELAHCYTKSPQYKY